MHISYLRRAWLGGVVIMTAALSISCTEGSTPSSSRELTPVEVSLGDVSLNKVAFLVAADNGIYEKYGLAVHQFITPNAADRIRRSGIDVPDDFVGKNDGDDAQISVGGGSPLIYSMTTDARATPRVILATTDSEARFHIISNKSLESVDALKGRRLGYSSPGSVSHLMALALLQRKGWSPQSDISLMQEGMDYSALKDGHVDAFIGSEIYYTMATNNDAKDLVDLTDYDIPIAGSGINAETKWFSGNRDAALRFLKATIESYALMKSKPDVVRAALSKWYKVTDVKQQDDMYQQVAASPEKPYPSVDGIKTVMQLFNYRELQRHQPTDFYDESLVAELDKTGFIDTVYAH
jgi:NitT/TauT family transport system substrate-binding protein